MHYISLSNLRLRFSVNWADLHLYKKLDEAEEKNERLGNRIEALKNARWPR